jgi:hypothetical protein
MQAAATAAGFSAVLPAKGRPAARSRVVARVPATRRSVRAAAVVATEAAQIDYSSSVSYVFPGLDQQTTSRCRAKLWMVWLEIWVGDTDTHVGDAAGCSRWRPATCLVATRATGPCSRRPSPPRRRRRRAGVWSGWTGTTCPTTSQRRKQQLATSTG